MSNKPGSITLVQLTRFGDILQTIWAVKDIRQLNPDLTVNIIVREKFGKPLAFLLEKYFTNIYYLNSNEFIGEDLTSGLDKTLKTINSWESNVLVNLSFSSSSSYLSSLIDANFKLGMSASQFASDNVNGSWSEYLYSTVMRGPLNSFSLVDIFKFILGTKNRPNLPVKSHSGDTIVIHPFASTEKKMWSPNKWGEIIFKTLKKNPELKIAIVGSHLDSARAKLIMQNPLLSEYHKRINLNCGNLDFNQLYNLLEESFLFCGHDSMVGHLASLAGLQTLTLSLGTVRAIESTPYGVNNYVLAPRTPCFPCFPSDHCSDFKCHKDLSYQAVTECLQQLIDTNEISSTELEKNVSPLHLSTADVFQSNFSKEGLFYLENISSNDFSMNELYRKFYRIVWLYMLEEMEENTEYPQLNKASYAGLEGFIPNLKQLFELAEFGKKYSRFILEEISKDQPDVEYIKSCGKKIEEIDEMQVLLGEASPALNPIIDFFNLKKSKMAGNNLVELCTSSHEIYQSIGSFCNIMYELIEKTMNEYSIKMKKNSMKEAKE
ncbi:MAG: hypothetical protein CME70_07065 [Halobacteriovorax sp.]|nr:hypothetical protein [Halobacteriovorax sp.]|tara:strand:- start:428849 stop:430492 length:1644 start_codon:yes stop_codon:yes gene_type:complete